MNWASKETEEQTPSIPLPDCGQRVSVESARHGDKLWTQMIGFKPGAYLVLEKPAGTDAVDGKHVLKDGDSLVIRFLKEGTIYGFRTPVLCTATVPYRLLFVGFPAEVAEHSLRASPRLECYLPCEGQVGGRAFTRAFIRDFSATGCQLRIPLDALEPEETDDEAAEPTDATEARGTHAVEAPGATRNGEAPEAAPSGAADAATGKHDSAPPIDADPDGDEPVSENSLTLELQLPGEDEIRIAHGEVLEWQTLPRFHQVRVKFDEPQQEVFEQLTVYTTRLD